MSYDGSYSDQSGSAVSYTHLHVGQGVETGIAQIAEQLNAVMWPEQRTTVLLETMAGKGSEVGRSFAELRQIIDGVQLQLSLIHI